MTKKKGSGSNIIDTDVCPHCHKLFMSTRSVQVHQRYCPENPERITVKRVIISKDNPEPRDDLFDQLVRVNKALVIEKTKLDSLLAEKDRILSEIKNRMNSIEGLAGNITAKLREG